MIFDDDDELDEEDIYKDIFSQPMATGEDFVKAVDELKQSGFIVRMTPDVQKLYDDVKEEYDESS